MEKKSTKQIGDSGENIACKFLEDRGYRVVDRNYRIGFGEVDVICEFKGKLVFVEVKARKFLQQGLPEEAVTPRKLASITRVAEHYIATKGLTSVQAQIDVVAIELMHKPPIIRHLKNVTG